MPSHSHSFDAGAAWVLISTGRGSSLPCPNASASKPAIGRRADKTLLPEPLQAREEPSGRRGIGEFVHAGNFAG